MILRTIRRRLREESGSMLVELLIAMTFLAVAVGALIAVYTSGVVSLRHASIQGNALTVVDTQMEKFKTLPYADLKLNAPTIPSPSDVYVSSPPSNLTSAQQASISSGQQTGGTYAATQTVTGPDNRTYRVDTYIFNATPSGGRGVLQVTVSARLVQSGAAGAIRAQVTSAVDDASTRVPPT